jgi:hypothetical protein
MLTTTPPFPTDDTPALIAPALRLFDAIWKPGLGFQKCGIMLTKLVAADRTKRDLFESHNPDRQLRLMRAVDALNMAYGADDPFWLFRRRQAQIIAPGEFQQRPLYDLVVRVTHYPLMPGWALIREGKPHERDLL